MTAMKPLQAAAGDGVGDQVDGLRGVRDVAAIDHRRRLAFEENDIVGR